MLSSITKSLASSYAMASPAAVSSRASSKNAIHHHQLPSMATLTQVPMEQACHTTLTHIALRALLSTPRPSLCSSKHCKDPPHTLLCTVCDSQHHHHHHVNLYSTHSKRYPRCNIVNHTFFSAGAGTAISKDGKLHKASPHLITPPLTLCCVIVTTGAAAAEVFYRKARPWAAQPAIVYPSRTTPLGTKYTS